MPVLVAWMFLAVLLAACGGAGGGGGDSADQPPLTPKTLVWVAPPYYIDGTPLDAGSELQCFEIFIKDSPAFGPEDTAYVWVGPMDRSIDLELLDPDLPSGATYYVSVRAVTMSGVKSAFSAVASFSL